MKKLASLMLFIVMLFSGCDIQLTEPIAIDIVNQFEEVDVEYTSMLFVDNITYYYVTLTNKSNKIIHNIEWIVYENDWPEEYNTDKYLFPEESVTLATTDSNAIRRNIVVEVTNVSVYAP